jgi:16S rRNA (guanine(966)-N(2))-methyltransferase RsmD
MRIISGTYGGRRFDTPRNLPARPTTDIAKESLFNILANRIDLEGIRALDLFAGTGSISFELLSRGAERVVSVEKGSIQQNYIAKVHDLLHLGSEHQLVRGDVFRYLNSCREGFDFIFADPPYDLRELSEVPRLVLEGELLRPGGLFVMEHGKTNDFSAHPLFRELRTYGAVHFSFFERPQLASI